MTFSQLYETKTLSKMICQNCMSFIQKIGDFKRSIKKNQEFLLQVIQKSEPKIELGHFVEVNVDVMMDTGIKQERDEEEFLNTRHSKRLKEVSKEEESLSDQEIPDETCIDSGSDEYTEKDSLSEDDYALRDKDSEPKSDKLPLPPLKFEKDTNAVWCPFCYQKFKHKYFLASHGKLRHPEYNWAFRKPKSTRTHWGCKFCDKVFSRRHRLKEHAMVVHFGREPYQCDLCGHTTQLKNVMRGHIESKHLKKYLQRPKKTVVCEVCNLFCATKEIYNNHMRSHQESKERPFKCVKCNLHFKKQKTLDKHNRQTHIVEDLPFACDLCISARFISEDLLNLHKKRHETDETKRAKQPFACSACELRFCKKSMLDNHVRHHEKNELDSCQVCGLTLHRSSLPDHMGKHETKYEDFENVCHLCGRRFRIEWSLLKHLKTHESQEFFECDKCGKTIKKKCNFTVRIERTIFKGKVLRLIWSFSHTTGCHGSPEDI